MDTGIIVGIVDIQDVVLALVGEGSRAVTCVLSNRLIYSFDRALLTLQIIGQRHELLSKILLLQCGLASQPVQHVLVLVHFLTQDRRIPLLYRLGSDRPSQWLNGPVLRHNSVRAVRLLL